MELPEGEQRFSQWSPELSALANICDKLGQVVNVLIVANGGEAVRFDPYPRPQTAMAQLVPIRRQQQHESLVMRLTPKDSPTA